MANWYCGECGKEFDAPGLSEEARCPSCGRVLTNDPSITRCILQDCGFTDEQINQMEGEDY